MVFLSLFTPFLLFLFISFNFKGEKERTRELNEIKQNKEKGTKDGSFLSLSFLLPVPVPVLCVN